MKMENGRHAIVYTYRMDERCAIDLGLPSGVRWSPINLGVETSNCMADTYMDESEIAAAINKLGKRLAWGELFEKDSYSFDSYIDAEWTIMPSDITETVYDAAKQLWGGHWSMPSAADINELIANTVEVSREPIHSDEISRTLLDMLYDNRDWIFDHLPSIRWVFGSDSTPHFISHGIDIDLNIDKLVQVGAMLTSPRFERPIEGNSIYPAYKVPNTGDRLPGEQKIKG